MNIADRGSAYWRFSGLITRNHVKINDPKPHHPATEVLCPYSVRLFTTSASADLPAVLALALALAFALPCPALALACAALRCR
ncbi:hypothetical protein VP1G_11260 [Cytospora mali]|uniref:Uncharacterized protein n=1 Tax=Cytospora mali TaxID=578113 RepID=A0A194V8R9_CYTMA|nr:hypothetical protein VP1G_11260 [Valsa mali var. pyri (nom. inval.)]